MALIRFDYVRYQRCECGFEDIVTNGYAREDGWTCPDCNSDHIDPVEVLDEQETAMLFEGADEEMELALR